MKVAIYEDNLIWSSRLAGAIKALGHEAIVLRTGDAPLPEGAELVIINLTSPTMDASALLSSINGRTFVIGHGGHKELAALPEGLKGACNLVTTNGKISMKFEMILDEALRLQQEAIQGEH